MPEIFCSPTIRIFQRAKYRVFQKYILTGFVNQDCILLSADGVVNPDGILIFLIHMSCKRISRIAVPQNLRHVFSNKKRLVVNHDTAD